MPRTTGTRASLTPNTHPPIHYPRVQLEKQRWVDDATFDLNDALDKLLPHRSDDDRVAAVRSVIQAVHRGLIDGKRVLPDPESTRGADALGWLFYAAGYRWPGDVRRAQNALTEMRLYAALTRPRRALDTNDLDRLLPRLSTDQPRSVAPLLQIEVLTIAVCQRDLPATSQALRLLQLTLDLWLAAHATHADAPASVRR